MKGWIFMGIKFAKIFLISLLIITSSICVTSKAEEFSDSVITSSANSLDENDDNPKEEKKIDYTKTSWNLESLFKSDDQWKKELKDI